MELFKFILLSFILVFLLSCAKGKICECTTSYSDGRPEVFVTHNIDYSNIQDCNIHESVIDENGITITTNCVAVDKK